MAARAKIQGLVAPRRWAVGKSIRAVIRVPDPVQRLWGGYLRAGNASDKLNQVDPYAPGCLVRTLLQRNDQRRWRPGRPPFRPRALPNRRFVVDHGAYELPRDYLLS
jgi:hypothetical protein